MKTTSKSTFLVLLLTLLSYSFSMAQDFERMDRRKRIRFTEESKAMEIKIHVDKDHDFIHVFMKGVFQEGDVFIDFVDSEGNVKGTLTAKNSTEIKKGKSTEVQGDVMLKFVHYDDDPIAGDWLIRVTPKKVTGTIDLHTTFLKNPTEKDRAEFIHDGKKY